MVRRLDQNGTNLFSNRGRNISRRESLKIVCAARPTQRRIVP